MQPQCLGKIFVSKLKALITFEFKSAKESVHPYLLFKQVNVPLLPCASTKMKKQNLPRAILYAFCYLTNPQQPHKAQRELSAISSNPIHYHQFRTIILQHVSFSRQQYMQYKLYTNILQFTPKCRVKRDSSLSKHFLEVSAYYLVLTNQLLALQTRLLYLASLFHPDGFLPICYFPFLHPMVAHTKSDLPSLRLN